MKKEYKVKYGKKVVAKTDIFLPKPFTNIYKGTPFYLEDAYVENKGLFIGIKQAFGIAEAGFEISEPIHSRMDVKKFVNTILIDYKEGTEYKIFEDGSYSEVTEHKAGSIIKL